MKIPRLEGETCEFKQSLSDTSSIVETICAFLNKQGGAIFVGVLDNGEIRGVDVGRNTIENISRAIREAITPGKAPAIEVLQANGKNILKIAVPRGEETPYFCRGKAFIRLGKTNVAMTSQEIEKEFKHRLSLERTFEDAPTNIRASHYGRSALEYFRANGREGTRSTGIEKVLDNLELEKQGKFNVAGLVCFGDNPQGRLPQFSFRCGVVKKGELISIDLIQGNIFEIIEKTFDYARTKIGSVFHIKGAVRRTTYEYPLEALREAIVNSLVHRDLNFPSSNYLAIYEDHLEVKNPGELPSALDISQLKQEHPSIQRNKKIANCLYLAGYIEHWGTGTTKIIKLCREAGLADPEFSQEHGFFAVKFWKKPPFNNARQQSAAEFIKKHGKVTSKTYSREFKVSERMARLDLSAMYKQGFIDRQKNGRIVWYMIKK